MKKNMKKILTRIKLSFKMLIAVRNILNKLKRLQNKKVNKRQFCLLAGTHGKHSLECVEPVRRLIRSIRETFFFTSLTSYNISNNKYLYNYINTSFRVFLLITVLQIILGVGFVYSTPINHPKNLWKGIIAENTTPDSYDDYYATACVVRNRLKQQMSHGLVAMKRKDLDSFVETNASYVKSRYNKDIEVWAKKAVYEVFYNDAPDITGGADHYEDVEKYGEPWWAKNMTITKKAGDRTFYRRK